MVLTFILGCLFYLSIFPFGGKGSAETFFSTYLAAPLFVFDYVVYKVSFGMLFSCTGKLTEPFQIYYKTKAAVPTEVDFSDARAFDEEDRLKAEEKAQRGEMKQRKTPIVQTLKNLVLG